MRLNVAATDSSINFDSRLKAWSSGRSDHALTRLTVDGTPEASPPAPPLTHLVGTSRLSPTRDRSSPLPAARFSPGAVGQKALLACSVGAQVESVPRYSVLQWELSVRPPPPAPLPDLAHGMQPPPTGIGLDTISIIMALALAYYPGRSTGYSYLR